MVEPSRNSKEKRGGRERKKERRKGRGNDSRQKEKEKKGGRKKEQYKRERERKWRGNEKEKTNERKKKKERRERKCIGKGPTFRGLLDLRFGPFGFEIQISRSKILKAHIGGPFIAWRKGLFSFFSEMINQIIGTLEIWKAQYKLH